MPRETIRHDLKTAELWDEVCKQNKDLLDEFVEYLSSTDKASTTIISYISDIKICFVWCLQNNNNKFFIEFTKRDIMKYQNYLVNTLKLSSNRVRRAKSTLSSLSNFIEAVLDEEYKDFRNIVNKIPAPIKQEVREKTILTDEQVEFLLKYLVDNKKYQMACAVALAASCGARKSELARFKVSYFNDDNIIFGSLYKTPEKITTKGRGSKGKMLFKYTLVNVFKPYFELWMEERKRLGIECDELFVTKRHGVWQCAKPSTLSSWSDTISKILEVDFYFHAERHYWTTNLRRSNLPDKVIQELSGWANSAMIDLYDDKEVSEELGKYFDADGIKAIDEKSISDLQ